MQTSKPADSISTKATTEDSMNDRPEVSHDADKEISKPEVPESKQAPLSRFKLYALLWALCLAIFLFALNESIVATAIPKITTAFNSLEDIGWYGSAFLLASCSLQPLSGKIYTHFPMRASFLVFMSTFTLGALISAVATSSKMLIVGRAIQGMGGAGIQNGAFSIIAAAAPSDQRPIIIGVGMGIAAIGMVIGPLVGGALTANVSWRWCFYINLPLAGMVIGILLCLTVPEQTEKPPVRSNLRAILAKLDLIGSLIFAPACIMFLLAINWGGNEYAWDSATVIGLFCGSVATFCLFGAWETRQGDLAMISPRIIKRRLVWSGILVSALQMGSVLMLSYYLPLWFQVVKGASPTMSGVMTLPTMISQGIAAIIAGKLVQVTGYCTPWAMFGSAVASIGSGLMTTFVPSTGAGAWIGYQILTGAGRGTVVQMPVTAIQTQIPGEERAIATSLIFFSSYFFGSIFLAAGETIFSNSLQPGLHKYAPNVDAQRVIDVGASGARSVVSKADLPGVLKAYNHAITLTFYLALAGAAAAFVASIGMGFKKLPQSGDKTSEKDDLERTTSVAETVPH